MNIDDKEIQKFDDISYGWWDPEGPFKPLHMLNPIRTHFIKSRVSLDDKSLIDVGCGGGLLCEPLSRLGAKMTGVDASNNNIEVAKLHSKEMNLDIKYIHSSPENLNLQNEFDVILNMEVVEHVSNVDLFIQNCS